MILIFEHDVRDHGRGWFNWRLSLFRGRWGGHPTWRLSWGLWSLSHYPSQGLRDFFDHAGSDLTEWRSQ